MHNEGERQEAEDEEIAPGPYSYALKLGLSAVAVHLFLKFGPGQNMNGPRRSVLDLCCAQGNIELA